MDEHTNGRALLEELPPAIKPNRRQRRAKATSDAPPVSPEPTPPAEPAYLSIGYFDKMIADGEVIARQLAAAYMATEAYQNWHQVAAQLDLLRSQRQGLLDAQGRAE